MLIYRNYLFINFYSRPNLSLYKHQLSKSDGILTNESLFSREEESSQLDSAQFLKIIFLFPDGIIGKLFVLNKNFSK